MSGLISDCLVMGFYLGGAVGFYNYRQWHDEGRILKVITALAWLPATGLQVGKWAARQPSSFEEAE